MRGCFLGIFLALWVVGCSSPGNAPASPTPVSISSQANREYKQKFKNGQSFVVRYQLTSLGDSQDVFFFEMPDGAKYRMDGVTLGGESGIQEVADKVNSPDDFLKEMKANGAVLTKL